MEDVTKITVSLSELRDILNNIEDEEESELVSLELDCDDYNSELRVLAVTDDGKEVEYGRLQATEEE